MGFTSRDPRSPANIQHYAAQYSLTWTLLASVVLIASPSILNSTLGWVPHFRGESAPNIPARFTKDLERLAEVFNRFGESNEISQNLPNSHQVDLEEKKMLDAIEAGLAAARRVDDEFLDWLHPGMQASFRDYLVKGHEEYLAGIRNKDPRRQYVGNALIGRWYDGFWAIQGKEITEKAFGKEGK